MSSQTPHQSTASVKLPPQAFLRIPTRLLGDSDSQWGTVARLPYILSLIYVLLGPLAFLREQRADSRRGDLEETEEWVKWAQDQKALFESYHFRVELDNISSQIANLPPDLAATIEKPSSPHPNARNIFAGRRYNSNKEYHIRQPIRYSREGELIDDPVNYDGPVFTLEEEQARRDIVGEERVNPDEDFSALDRTRLEWEREQIRCWASGAKPLHPALKRGLDRYLLRGSPPRTRYGRDSRRPVVKLPSGHTVDDKSKPKRNRLRQSLDLGLSSDVPPGPFSPRHSRQREPVTGRLVNAHEGAYQFSSRVTRMSDNGNDEYFNALFDSLPEKDFADRVVHMNKHFSALFDSDLVEKDGAYQFVNSNPYLSAPEPVNDTEVESVSATESDSSNPRDNALSLHIPSAVVAEDNARFTQTVDTRVTLQHLLTRTQGFRTRPLRAQSSKTLTIAASTTSHYSAPSPPPLSSPSPLPSHSRTALPFSSIPMPLFPVPVSQRNASISPRDVRKRPREGDENLELEGPTALSKNVEGSRPHKRPRRENARATHSSPEAATSSQRHIVVSSPLSSPPLVEAVPVASSSSAAASINRRMTRSATRAAAAAAAREDQVDLPVASTSTSATRGRRTRKTRDEVKAAEKVEEEKVRRTTAKEKGKEKARARR